ncbi:hypothetical protein Bca4012_065213 [Brassica carinata]
MNRPRKKKESSLLNELKELELLGDGEFVDIPELENEDLIEENSMSIVVRCPNLTFHKVGGLVKALPPIWGMEESVKGRGVSENMVQFFFQNERDIQHVLTKGPWFVNGWIVSLDKWSPNPGPEFLCRIPFWIRIRGIPVHLLKKQAIEGLLGPLGHVEKVDLYAKNSSSVEYVRALVWIHTEEPLQFKRVARFKSGEIVPTEMEYEKLIKVCFSCKRLTHDQLSCPLQAEAIIGSRGSRVRDSQASRAAELQEPSRRRMKGLKKSPLYRDRDPGSRGRTTNQLHQSLRGWEVRSRVPLWSENLDQLNRVETKGDALAEVMRGPQRRLSAVSLRKMQLPRCLKDWDKMERALGVEVQKSNCGAMESENQTLQPHQNLRVSDLRVNDGKEWNLELLAKLFPDEEQRKILQIRTCGRGSKDVYIWTTLRLGNTR